MAPPPPAAEPDPAAKVFAPDDEEGFAAHFREHGFVVVAPVLSGERCDATVEELWRSPSLLGAYPSISRADPETWGGDDWPAGCRNFLDPLDPCSEVESWWNRVDGTLAKVFARLWRDLRVEEDGPSEDPGEIVVSVDRMGLMRPTKPEGLPERPHWRTSRNWLHWDQNPWLRPDFFALQGLVGLSEADASCGGWVTVPGFHRQFAEWGPANPEGSLPRLTRQTVPFPVPLGDEMQGRRQKVLVPKGGLLVWDSRMPHENFPNEGAEWRLCQYITCKRLLAPALKKRAAAWHAGLRTGLIPAAFARRFSPEQQGLLGMAPLSEQRPALEEALRQGEGLSEEALEAARKLKRAYRLKQTAMDPVTLQEAKRLFGEAFATNPGLKEPLQCVAAAEDNYLPFWIL